MASGKDKTFSLTPKNIYLRPQELQEPDEDDAVQRIANHAETVEDYYTLVDMLGLNSALERMRNAEGNKLRCV